MATTTARMVGSRLAFAVILGGVVAACGSTPDPSSLQTIVSPGSPQIVIESDSPSLVASPSASPSPTPTAAPWTTSVKTLGWHRLAAIPRSETSRVVGEIDGSPVNSLVGFSKGYAILDGEAATVSFSSNGRSWKKVKLPTPARPGSATDGSGLALATDGKELLIVGGYEHGPCRVDPPDSAGGGPACPSTPTSWTSSDGLHWRSSHPGQADVADEFVATWPVAGGGWDAAASDWSGEDLGGQTIWHSADGLSWKPLTQTPPAAWEGYDRVPFGIASGSGGYLLAASQRGDPHMTLAAGADGQPWRVLGSFPGDGAEVVAGVAPADDRTTWVLAGRRGATISCDDHPGDACEVGVPTVWSSADGVRWTVIVLPVGPAVAALEPGDPPVTVTAVTSLVHSERGYVAVGAEGRPEDWARHETWVSDDGVSWKRLPGSERPRLDYGPGLIADGPAGVIGISGSKGEDELVVWQLR